MLDAPGFAALSPADRLVLLDQFTAAAFPGATQAAIAQSLGYRKRAWQTWRQHPEKIPVVVLLLLQEWATEREENAMPRAMVELAARLADTAAALSAAAEALQQIEGE